MRETGVYTRLFVGLVSPLAFLRLNPPLMALLGLVFCFVLQHSHDVEMYHTMYVIVTLTLTLSDSRGCVTVKHFFALKRIDICEFSFLMVAVCTSRCALKRRFDDVGRMIRS